MTQTYKEGQPLTFGECIELYGFNEAARMLSEYYKRRPRPDAMTQEDQ